MSYPYLASIPVYYARTVMLYILFQYCVYYYGLRYLYAQHALAAVLVRSQTRVCTGMTSMPRGRGGASLQASVATLRHYRPGLRPGTFKKKKKVIL